MDLRFSLLTNINLQPRKKHDIEQTNSAEQNNTAVAQHQVQSVRANNRSGNNQADQAWNFQPTQKNRRKQDDKQYQ